MTLPPKPRQTRTTLTILLGSLATTAILSVLGAFGFLHVYELNAQLRQAAQERAYKVNLVEDMLAAGHLRFEIAFVLYAGETRAERLRAQRRYVDFVADFDAAREGFIALGLSAEEEKLMERVDEVMGRIKDFDARVATLVAAGATGAAIWPSLTEMLKINDQLETGLRRLLEFQRVAGFREVADASNRNEDTYRFVLVLFGVALGASVLVAWWVTRLVGRGERALFEEKELAEATLSGLAEGVITVNVQGGIEYLNPAAERLTGWRLTEARAQPLRDVYRLLELDSRLPLLHPANSPVNRPMTCSGMSHLLVARDNREFEVEDLASPIHDSDGGLAGAVLVFRDVTASQEMSRKLVWQASHDALTGLVNRIEFENRLKEAIAVAKSHGKLHALMFVDLDQFKVVNDTCGHIAGDQMLCQIGVVIQDRIRDSDLLARLGGDEFGILLTSCGLEQALKIGHDILESLRKFRFAWHDKIFTVGASIGLVPIDGNTQDATQLMSAADLACYAAKEAGRDRIQLFDPENESLKRISDMGMVAQINRAMDQGLFRLYRQKIAGLQWHTADQQQYEILLRMIDANGHVLEPAAFLPIAERYSLMKAIDRWVLRETFAYLQRARAQQNLNGTMHTINLSGASINDDEFLDYLKQQIAEYKILPQSLCFEVTETIAIANLPKAAGLMRSVKELGSHFSLDDFGTGMSSFAYLKYLPVGYLKIDGAFVRDVLSDRIDHEIVDAIIRVCRALGIRTIAEFVEDESTKSRLRTLGVDYAQGYAIGKPMPLE
jgi:diguanylate cyclase (GGDEF)-like protein/PAS domain S-box-containing protein